MPRHWSWDDATERAVRDLAEIVPETVFDAHAHLYRASHFPIPEGSFMAEGPETVGAEEWRRRVGRLLPSARLEGALFLGMPMRGCDLAASNAFVAEQLALEPSSRGLVVAAPDTPPEEIEKLLDNPAFRGLKPYHLLSGKAETFESDIEEYAPEWMWRLAHERGLVILLHMVKERALADPGNQRDIRRLCAKHPSARLVLAHAARGFHAPNTVKGIKALRGLDNVWFDTSGICEAAPLAAILREFGPRRLMFGTDFPISEQRARAVTIGDQFVWIEEQNLSRKATAPAWRAMPCGVESLRALRDAADQIGLNEGDLADVFHGNARRLLGMDEAEGSETQALYRRARALFPGGAQLLSKRPEMKAPGQWPAYFREARGCEIWDLDGRRYWDFSIVGIGASVLGFNDPDVTRAVQRRVALGSWCTLNPPEEVELAERLLAIHPWAERARFQRAGGEAMAAAVRIARATTDRSEVAICGYHGWHDWYLAANLGEDDTLRGHLLPGLHPLGVPRELRGTTHAFAQNDLAAFDAIIAERGDRLAAVVMEPCRGRDPEPGFLEHVRDAARAAGALLVFDEITIGWRLHYGGAHLRFGVEPDIAVFAKSLGAGHPMSAIIGTAQAMEGAHTSFVSSTYWTEGVGPAAALAALRKMERSDVPAHVARIGTLVQDVWRRGLEKHGLPGHVRDGYPCLSHFAFEGEQGDVLRTLFNQYMLELGFLAGCGFYPTLAHTDEHVEMYAEAADEAFAKVADALGSGEPEKRLKGPVAHTGFRRLL